MVESIAATSLLGQRPIYGSFSRKSVSTKKKLCDPCLACFRKLSIGRKACLIKAQAMELTKEAYAFREKERMPKDLSYGIDSYVDRRPGLWTPENKADNPSLGNPLLRQERLGCGWICAILELDGVLIEDNPDHENQAWLALSHEEGESPPLDFVLQRIEGMKNEQAISEVLCWARDPGQVRRLATRKEELYQSLHGGLYRFRPGSAEFVKVLMDNQIPMALVSTKPREHLERAVRAIGVEGVFNVIVAADDVYRGKPDPEMFIYAGQLMQFIPERCIVFGNSNQTIEAAHDARMKCVGVASKHPVYELGAAEIVVTQLDELSMVDLKSLADVEWEFGETELEMEPEEEDDKYPPSVGVDFW